MDHKEASSLFRKPHYAQTLTHIPLHISNHFILHPNVGQSMLNSDLMAAFLHSEVSTKRRKKTLLYLGIWPSYNVQDGSPALSFFLFLFFFLPCTWTQTPLN